MIKTLCLGPEKKAARLPPLESISTHCVTDGDFRMISIQNTTVQSCVLLVTVEEFPKLTHLK